MGSISEAFTNLSLQVTKQEGLGWLSLSYRHQQKMHFVSMYSSIGHCWAKRIIAKPDIDA